MTLQPPLIIGSIQVTSVLPAPVRSVHMLFHVKCSKQEVHSPEIVDLARKHISVAMKYLADEGFIVDKDEKWIQHVSAICHDTI